MGEIKDRFDNEPSNTEKQRILTLSPLSIRETVRYFNTTKYMAEEASKLKAKYGILPVLEKTSKGKVITGKIKSEVVEFYERIDISKILTGTKVVKPEKDENGRSITVQKRLILSTLKDTYQIYKNELTNRNPPEKPIGLSSFAALRPKWCVLAGPKGTHTVCTCIYHQNPKLMVSAIGQKDLEYKTLMKKCVCNEDLTRKDCMLQQCKSCPGKAGISTFLGTVEKLNDRETIKYHQWTMVDRAEMTEIIDTKEDFIEKLTNKIFNLTRHHIISKIQAKYLQDLKENLQENEVAVIGDFAENYTILIQDEIQSFHWSNIQIVLHPMFVIYKSEGKINHYSYCMITDYMKHDVNAVYTFQKKLIADLKDESKIPQLEKIHYFSDGCGEQYKNKYNFTNLWHHEDDFKIKCEWNFFATSHGRNPCDGIGGTLKGSAYKHSLRSPDGNFILNAQQFYDHVTKTCLKIKSIFVPSFDIHTSTTFLESRFSTAQTLKGTRSFHKFVPDINVPGQIQAFYTSTDESFETHSILPKISREKLDDIGTTLPLDETNCLPGKYIGVSYENKLYTGLIECVSEEFGDYYVKFMKEDNGMYKFTMPEDKCWVKTCDVISILSQPEIKCARPIKYSFPSNEIMHLQKVIRSRKSD